MTLDDGRLVPGALEALKLQRSLAPHADALAAAVAEVARARWRRTYCPPQRRDLAMRLAEGLEVSTTALWARLAPFEGPWEGRWRELTVRHRWEPPVRDGLPPLAGASLVACQYAWVGDGYGWNLEVAADEGARHLLGTVVHLNDGAVDYQVPHVGLVGQPGEVAWITPDRFYVERAEGARYQIVEHVWSVDGDKLVSRFSYETEYRRA